MVPLCGMSRPRSTRIVSTLMNGQRQLARASGVSHGVRGNASEAYPYSWWTKGSSVESCRPRWTQTVSQCAERRRLSSRHRQEESRAAASQLIEDLHSRSDASKLISTQECYRVLEWLKDDAQNRSDISMACRARDLVQAMESHSKKNASLRPTRDFYDLVLQAFAVCNGGRRAAEEAEGLLMEMIQHASDYDGSKPNSKTFNIAISCWSRSKESDAGTKALDLLQQMKEYHEKSWDKIGMSGRSGDSMAAHFHGSLPNARSLAGVIDAWRHSKDKDASLKIRAIVDQAIFDDNSSKNSTTTVDTVVFNTAIRAIAELQPNRAGIQQAEDLLALMERVASQKDAMDSNRKTELLPNTQTYAMFVHAWSLCEGAEGRGDAAENATKVLQLMVKKFQDGENVKPNTKVFTSCISAWLRCSKTVPDAPTRAQEILDGLIELHTNTGDPDFHLDTAVFNAVIAAWARSQHVDRVEKTRSTVELLKRFAEPDIVSYNSLLYAYSSEGNASASLELLEWLQKESAMNTLVQPDVVTYNTVIYSLARQGTVESATRAQEIFRHLLGGTMFSRGTQLHPTNATLSSVILAWMQSKSSNALVFIREAYEEARAARPPLRMDAALYSSLLQATVEMRSLDRPEDSRDFALHIMDTIFRRNLKLRDDGLYLRMIQACNHLLVEDEQLWKNTMQSILRSCTERGLLSRRLLSSIRNGSPMPDAVRLLFGSTGTGHFPKSWSAKLPQRFRP